MSLLNFAIPDGWRVRVPGERRREGDLLFALGATEFQSGDEVLATVGRVIEENDYLVTLTRVDPITPPEPKEAAKPELISMDGPGPLAPIGTPKVIDWTKPVQTSGKFPSRVHIYAIDHRLTKPVIGRQDGDTRVGCWNYDGTWMAGETGCLDLMNVPVAADTGAK